MGQRGALRDSCDFLVLQRCADCFSERPAHSNLPSLDACMGYTEVPFLLSSGTFRHTCTGVQSWSTACCLSPPSSTSEAFFCRISYFKTETQRTSWDDWQLERETRFMLASNHGQPLGPQSLPKRLAQDDMVVEKSVGGSSPGGPSCDRMPSSASAFSGFFTFLPTAVTPYPRNPTSIFSMLCE